MSLRCGKGGCFMEKLEIRMQEELFDVETQYCDPDDCYHDCKPYMVMDL